MSHIAPDLRACHPKWPHCLWGWHSAFQGQTEKESSGAGESGKGIPAPSEVPSGIAPRLIQSPLESQYRAVPGGSAAECLMPEHAQTCSAGLGWVRTAGHRCLKVVLF